MLSYRGNTLFQPLKLIVSLFETISFLGEKQMVSWHETNHGLWGDAQYAVG